ncbi:MULTISPECIES: mechanosensitive ion channel family protein [unclassified Granulicatella]|uniref:mechanosensitive ion channel family protein n=1 Tax=unclassified Granulicatella TaxID=2630493 RepID=UPI0010739DA0|nr:MULTISPECIES: mechanosensitive ion channel domain-containing protein [unclassified Granulicatella]MBF0781106.1 mechanosensitive ion channel [Granulicatella sp. 19428wC4_WM01]TFU92026.1 mechanosensitive ion channel [Granulicatella sp. WM01]
MKEIFDKFISQVIDKGVSLIILFCIYLFIEKILVKSIKKIYKERRTSSKLVDPRTETLYKLFMSGLHYVLYFFIGYAALSILGFPMATLIAGAGIAGLVIGLGAQGFINDLVNGIFILIEHQFDVNDAVVISGIEGKVKSIGLRITTLIGYDGSLYYLRNKDISAVNNLSKGTRRVLIQLYIKNQSDLPKIIHIINTVNQHNIAQFPDIVKDAEHIGLQVNAYGQLYYSIALYTKPAAYTTIQHIFYQKYIEALTQENISIVQNLMSSK